VLARYRRAALVVVPALLIAGTLSALTGTADARPGSDSIARGQQSQQCQSASSSQASCGFATEIQLPLAISITAKASPESGQSATITWTVSCSVNGGDATSSSGTRTGATPLHANLTLPKSEDGDCTLNATNRLNGSGGMTAVLDYTLATQVMVSVPTTDPKQGAPLAYFLCMRDSRQSHAPGAQAVLGSCSSVYVGAWTYNGKTLVHGGLCLTDPRGGWIRTKLVLDRCTGAADQTWSYQGSGQGEGPFVLKSPHLCLDDPKYTKVINTPLSVYSCNRGPDESWTLSQLGGS
jgi:hypothetical protein